LFEKGTIIFSPLTINILESKLVKCSKILLSGEVSINYVNPEQIALL